jgi:hypothetical protein
MLELPEQLPVYIIADALDECPNDAGTPSARDKVLDAVEGLIRLDKRRLFICVTSRPEQDVTSVFEPLTSSSCLVSLHEEHGQREDINDFVRAFVQNDRAMRRWRAEDKELVVNELTERANGM